MSFSLVGCPKCGHVVTHVLGTRGPRRYRKCVKCKTMFTTYEVSEHEYAIARGATEQAKLEAKESRAAKRST